MADHRHDTTTESIAEGRGIVYHKCPVCHRNIREPFLLTKGGSTPVAYSHRRAGRRNPDCRLVVVPGERVFAVPDHISLEDALLWIRDGAEGLLQ